MMSVDRVACSCVRRVGEARRPHDLHDGGDCIVLEEKSPRRPGTNDDRPDAVQGKAQILEYLKESLAYARQAMASLSEKNQLDRRMNVVPPSSRR